MSFGEFFDTAVPVIITYSKNSYRQPELTQAYQIPKYFVGNALLGRKF